jgi:hypothetical protein
MFSNLQILLDFVIFVYPTVQRISHLHAHRLHYLLCTEFTFIFFLKQVNMIFDFFF